MSTVNLDDDEWQRVLGIISQAPWNIANPLLMKIGEQLRRQASVNSGLPSGDQMQENPAKSQQLGDKHTH